MLSCHPEKGYYKAGFREYFQQLRDAVDEKLIDYSSAKPVTPETENADYLAWQKQAAVPEEELAPEFDAVTHRSKITHKTLRTNQTWSSF